MPFIVKQQAQLQKDRIAIEFREHTVSYRTLFDRVKAVASFLQHQGFQKNDVIGMLLDNHHELPIVYFAIQYAGYIVMPINTKLAPTEIAYILQHSEARAVIANRHLKQKVLDTGVRLAYCWTLDELPHVQNNVFEEPTLHEDDTAIILYTSGTTGQPKGVMLSHRAIYATASQWADAMQLTTADRMFICTPMFHCAGLHVFLNPTILTGGTIILEQVFSARAMPTWLRDSEATIFFGVPAMYMMLLNNEDFRTFDLSHLRLFKYGAAPMPYELITQLRKLFPHVKLQNSYGQTENGPCATTLTDDAMLEKIGSVGKPASPQTEMTIFSPDGAQLPAGVVGEIGIRGPHVMTGYLKNEQETARTLKDGWLLTGDLGRIDEEGYLFIVDRKKDMLIRAGENVYPVEVEEVLFQLPAILEAAVVGIPHPIYGEVPKAYVSLKEGQSLTTDEMQRYCLTRLAKYKVPVELEILQELPRNASGKVLKHVLRAQT